MFNPLNSLKMKKMGNSYSSAKTVDSLRKAVSLTTEQSEALVSFFNAYDFYGDLEVSVGDVTLQLSLRGRTTEEELLADKEIFQGRVDILADTIWGKSVQALLLKDWEGSESLVSYGEIRHQMIQMSRGYLSKAKTAKAEEKAAYRKVANRLLDKKEVREMLSFLGKVRSISVNTFEVVRGQGGRIRIAYFV